MGIAKIVPKEATELMSKATHLLEQFNKYSVLLQEIGIDFTEHVHPHGKCPMAEFNQKITEIINAKNDTPPTQTSLNALGGKDFAKKLAEDLAESDFNRLSKEK